MALKTYAKKRDFTKTPEPSGKEKAPAKTSAADKKMLTFVIQKHSASHLHYDFRLECGGVLLSWAVPKGPSLDPSVKRLAMAVEDHPISYGSFEGIIPAGQYGGGEVIVWDNGTYCTDTALEGVSNKARPTKLAMSRAEQEKEMMAGLKSGKLAFTLYGKKLHGSFTLVRTARDPRSWLLIKHKDEFVDTEHDITEDENSVLSKKTIASLKKANPDAKPEVPDKKTVAAKKIASTKTAKTKAATATKKVATKTSATKTSATKSSAIKKKDLEFKPMLASLAAKPFSQEGWVYEPKLDGIRAIAYINGGDVQLKSRGGLDINGRFPAIVQALAKNGNVVIDGEVVALDDEGKPSFQLLQSRGTTSGVKAQAKNLLYYVFDILAVDGESVCDQAQAERYKLLSKKLKTAANVKLVEELDCDGETAYEICIKNGLEGIVAKRTDAIYQPGKRSADWIKVKGTQSAEFVICGYSAGTGTRLDTFGSLLVGYYKDDKLHYAGGVGTGFNQQLIKDLLARLKPLTRKTSPFAEKVQGKGKPVWVEPKLVAEIKYHEITADGRLRIPVFMRLRDDIKPTQTGATPPVAPPAKSTKEKKSVSKSELKTNIKSKTETKPKAAAKTRTKGAGATDKKAAVGDIEAIAHALGGDEENLKLVIGEDTINFSHLNKILWPGKKKSEGLTKRDFAQYLLAVSPYMLPHLKDRPLTLIRFPNGVGGQKFFQKHWDKNIPPFVETFDSYADHAGENHRFLLCQNVSTLMWLAQIADLELHTSHARIGPAAENKKLTLNYTDTLKRIEASTLNYPDYLVLDLDPYIYSGKEAAGEEPELNKKGFKKACEMAQALRGMLEDLNMDAFVKTSGRTGLHIYVPLVRNIDYPQVRLLAETIGRHLMGDHPKVITMDWAVVKRTGKIFFDHNMNARGKTLASIYSPRNSLTGTVSTPLDWDELGDIYPDHFTLKTVPERLAKVGDLWADILDHKSDVHELLKNKALE